jgi:hypothetical protein
LPQLSERFPIVEQARIKKVRRKTSCFGLEFAKAQDIPADGKLDELLSEIGHDNGFGKSTCEL